MNTDQQLYQYIYSLALFEIKYLIQKMMERHFQVSPLNLRPGLSPQAAKENYLSPTQIPKVPNKFNKSQSIYPTEQIHSSHSPQWATSGSSGFSKTVRVVSPNSILTTVNPINVRRSEIIELGGSREKRDSMNVNKESVVRLDESRKVDLSTDGLIRKISMLQGRIRELHRDKQQSVSDLNERLKKMQMENDRLSVLVHSYENRQIVTSRRSEKCVQAGEEEEAGQFGENSLEEMLSNQININLELREENEKLMSQLELQAARSAKFQQKFNTSQLQKQDILRIHNEELTVLRNQKLVYLDNQKQLEEQLNQLEDYKMKRENMIEELIQEKEKRILELQEESYSQATRAEEKGKEITELQEELSSCKLENAQIKEQLEHLRQSQLEKQDCKKCKDLLHTVFRLNCQLNKK